MMTMQSTIQVPVTGGPTADPTDTTPIVHPSPAAPQPAPGRPGGWVQPISAQAEALGIETDIYMVMASQAAGCWWMRETTKTIGRRDADAVEAWVGRMGLLAVLQAHGPGDPTVVPSVRNEADVARVQRLINENLTLFANRQGRWVIGDVLRLLWEHRPTVKVLQERGIAVSDLRHGIEAALGESIVRTTGDLFVRDVIRELSCLHRGRLAFLFVEERAGTQRLVARSQQHTNPCTKQGNAPAHRLESAEHEVGQIVWVAVEENNNGRKSRKRHPAVLLARTGRNNAKWLILTMTTEVPGHPDYRRVPDAASLGLDYPGFVWHEVQKVHKSQVEHTVGWIHRPLLQVVHNTIGLRQAHFDELRRIADAHHAVG